MVNINSKMVNYIEYTLEKITLLKDVNNTVESFLKNIHKEPKLYYDFQILNKDFINDFYEFYDRRIKYNYDKRTPHIEKYSIYEYHDRTYIIIRYNNYIIYYDIKDDYCHISMYNGDYSYSLIKHYYHTLKEEKFYSSLFAVILFIAMYNYWVVASQLTQFLIRDTTYVSICEARVEDNLFNLMKFKKK